MIKSIDYRNREEWLKNRTLSLGASEIAVACGMSNFKTVQELWEEKTGKVKPADLSENERVKYGTLAESPLRELFQLKYIEEYKVDYFPYKVYFNDETPYLTCTLDGEITRISDKAKGVYECKTVLVNNKDTLDAWKGKIPDYYYCQTLQQMYCTGFQFVVLNVELRFPNNNSEIREYLIKRQEEDIAWVVSQGKKFWNYVVKNIRPPIKITI